MRRRAKIAAAWAGMLAALAVAGCGGDGASEEEQVAEVVEAFVEAGNQEDAAAACELLAAEQAARIGKVGGGGCEKVLGGFLAAAGGRDTSVEIADVRIDGSRATADVTITQDGARRDESLLLVEEDGEWRLASAGL